MKKITGFFMAILPFFVVILLFASGMIVKRVAPVIHVSSVGFDDTDGISIRKEEDSVEPQYAAPVTVLPKNATHPELIYTTEDDSVVKIDQAGVLTATGYGQTRVKATSMENENISDVCNVEVWDDKVHGFKLLNPVDVEYVSSYESVKLNVAPVPSTHLSQDPKIHFESDNKAITVTDDGQIQADEITGDTTTATITVTSQAYPTAKSLPITVKLGQGIKVADFVNPNNETISSSKYDLASQLKTYPDTNSELPKKVFNYSSDNKDIATISSDGQIEFKQPGTATFTAAYKRDETVFAKKTITSTCSYVKDVNFNTYTYTGKYEDFMNNRYIQPNDLNLYIYPETTNYSNVDIVSDNTAVIEVIKVQPDQMPQFKVNGPGQATLTANVKTGDPETPIKSDKCVVTIMAQPSTSDTIFKRETVDIDTGYYALRDNIDTQKLYPANASIEWSIKNPEGGNIADLDEKNGIVHFYQGGDITVTAKVNDTSYSFKLSSDNETQGEVDINNPVLEVGKKYTIDSSVIYDQDAWKKYFYIETAGETGAPWFIIPKRGGTYNVPTGILTSIDFIIKEKPISIAYKNTKVDNGMYVSSSPTLKFVDDVQPIILPYNFDTNTTYATKEDGTSYTMNYSYDVDPNVGTVTDNTIEFKTYGYATAHIKCEDIENTVEIKNINGDSGKFNLTTTDSNEVISSGDTIYLDNNTERTLTINASNFQAGNIDFAQAVKNLKVYSTSDNKICDTEITNTDSSISIKIKATSYGQDTLVIQANTFRFYLNVNISSAIAGFLVYYHGQLLEATNKTYTTNLVLDVILLPTAAADKEYTVKFNGVDIPLGERKLKIDLSGANWDKTGKDNTLVLSAGSVTKEIKLNYQENIETFNLAEADLNGNVYIGTNDTRSYSTIQMDGLIDKDFYKEKFSVEVLSPTTETSKLVTSNKFEINGIAAPTDANPEYTKKIKVTYKNGDKTISKQYTLIRQLVSDIQLPDINMIDDTQRGHQKVRVFGNYSFYNPQEGLIDYYKLNVNLYNYKHDLITDPVMKEKAFNQLVCNIGQNAIAKYNKQGFVEIHFNKQSFYTYDEMANNAFANASNKNVGFSLSTPLYDSVKVYEFVTVEGINTYSQEIMVDDTLEKQTTADIVLQSNFNKEGAVKENTPLNNTGIYHFDTIYGNGFTLNFNDNEMASRAKKENYAITSSRFYNAIIQGCNSNNHNIDTTFYIKIDWGKKHIQQEKRCCVYTSIFNANNPLIIDDEDVPTYIKNCAFYNNIGVALSVSGDKSAAYIQDCVFFDCATLAINVSKFAQLNIKGFIDVYNFKSKNDLVKMWGTVAEFAWNQIEAKAQKMNMMHISPSGIQYINLALATELTYDINFWDAKTKTYIQGTKGNPDAAPYITSFFTLPLVNSVTLWATPNIKGAPAWDDEFDRETETVKWDFLKKQIKKIDRIVV